MGNAEGHYGKRALKEVSVQQLETAIAAALYKITAHKYHVDIKRFDLDLGIDSALRDGAVIEMRVADTGICMTRATSRFTLDAAPACQNAPGPGHADQAPALNRDDVKV